MRNLLLPLAAVAATAALSLAQEAILPSRTYYNATGSSTATWRSTAFRFQMFYDTSNFTDQGINGPVTITRLRFRAANGVVNAGGHTYAAANVQMSSCPVDYLVASTTFATNRGANNQLCYTGPVTLAAAAGTTPNTYIVDITLATPFTYDPSLGLDLVVEVDSAAPVPATTFPSFATSSGQPTEKARRLSTNSTTLATGGFSNFASEILIDFTGPGGYSTWTQAASSRQGVGCYTVARSYYEDFPGTAPVSSNDLSNKTVTMVQNANGGYTVTTSNGATVVPPTAAGFAMTDDSERTQALPFTFDYPGGTTSSIVIGSNGYINLNGLTSGSVVLGSRPFPQELLVRQVTVSLAGRHILAGSLQDLEPDGATNVNNVHGNVDPSNPNIYLITWNNVNCWHATTQPTPARSLFQIALIDNGTADTVEFRYQTLVNDSDNGFFAAGEAVTGFSLGLNSVDPGSSDLTAGPISTGAPEQAGLAMSSSTPFIGATLTHTISNIPANVVVSARLIGFIPVPGVDLGSIGAPGCKQWIDSTTATTELVFGTPTGTVNLAVPNVSWLLGAVLYAQGASLVPGVNALGVLTSNGNTLTFGNTN